MLAGGIASVDVRDPAQRAALRAALARMGVRTAEPGDPAVEFAFTATAPGAAPGAAAPAAPGGPAPLPPVTVGLDGSIDSPRGADAAARIDWAARGMPATAQLAAGLREATGASAPRIAVSLVLEPKTAAFTLALAAAGCEVAVFSAVSETDPEVAAALAATGRVTVCAPLAPVTGDWAVIDARNAAAVLDWAPELLIDDGSHLVRLAHSEKPEALATLRAAAEETTSGVRPLHEMAAAGELRIPVIAVNDARTKTGFDNLIGTGQSCVFAIADLCDAANPHYRGVAGSRWAVLGYGPVGQGVARFAAALGARITVVEQDPVRALAALHDGFDAAAAVTALPAADVVVSATGVWHTLDAAGVALLRPDTVVAVAGGIDDELALDELVAAGWTARERAPRVAEWRAPGATAGPLVLAEGGGVNYSAGEGNPIEVMDLSFATQLAALTRLLTAELSPGVHTLSVADEHAVARAALAARGGSADATPQRSRPGGAAQPWTVHRYRATRAAG
ncbi:adenosylhomocysteinase [Leucobacter luti]|nr:adenosylhomocysteinase [Leucobacter luti]MBL3698360.1 adenosylhomocysteinase [Leucobacter luti]